MGMRTNHCGGGVTTVLTADTMTRGPAIDFPSIVEAARARAWITSPQRVTGRRSLVASRPDIFEGGTRRDNLRLVYVVFALKWVIQGHPWKDYM
jgi:hydroxymethylglutaryl-CoA reductase